MAGNHALSTLLLLGMVFTLTTAFFWRSEVKDPTHRTFRVSKPGRIIRVSKSLVNGKVEWRNPYGAVYLKFSRRDEPYKVCFGQMKHMGATRLVLRKTGRGWTPLLSEETGEASLSLCTHVQKGEQLTIRYESYLLEGPIKRDRFTFHITSD